MLLGLIPFATPAGLSDVEDARWRVQRAAALGLDVIQVPLRSRDDAYLKTFRDLAGEQGIELEAGIGPDFVSRSPLSAEELAPFIATIRAALSSRGGTWISPRLASRVTLGSGPFLPVTSRPPVGWGVMQK